MFKKIISQTPVRIGLIGGGTDVNPFAAKYGGKVLSLAITIFHKVTLVPREDRQILIENLGEVRHFSLDDKLPKYGEDKKFDLVYAIINHFRNKFPSGFNLYDRFSGCHSGGLGSSGSSAVAIIGAINYWLKLELDRKKIALLAWEMETAELGWVQGKQDQLAAAYGGINLMTFGPGKNFNAKPLNLTDQHLEKIRDWSLLVYTGGSRHSATLQQKLKKGMSEPSKIKALKFLKKSVSLTKDYLNKLQLAKLGKLLDKAWEQKKLSNPDATNLRIDFLYELAKDQGALGGKIMGAGGEGHMFFLCPPEKKNQVISALEAEGAFEIDFQFDQEGLVVHEIKAENNYHLVVIREGFSPKRNWAVFLDRDGTINKEVHLLHKLEDFKLIPRAAEAIKKLNRLNIPVIVYHNASAVARGLCGEERVQAIHRLMITELKKQRTYVDAIFYCPHHQTAFDLNYISDCSWRKPESGMIKQAAKMFQLDLKKSYVIGDNARDILMGSKEKCQTILVKTGHGGKDGLYKAKADYISDNLFTAIKYLLKKENLE